MSVPERLVFQPTMQSLLEALGSALDPGCAARLRAVGVDAGAPLLDAYPVAVFAAALRVGAAAVCPSDPLDEGVRELGRRFVRQFSATRVGKAALTVVKLLGPDAFVRHLGRAIRFGDNYSNTRVEPQGERHWRVSIFPAQLHPFYEGLLEAGLAATGARGVRARLDAPYQEGFTFSVRWD